MTIIDIPENAFLGDAQPVEGRVDGPWAPRNVGELMAREYDAGVDGPWAPRNVGQLMAAERSA